MQNNYYSNETHYIYNIPGLEGEREGATWLY